MYMTACCWTRSLRQCRSVVFKTNKRLRLADKTCTECSLLFSCLGSRQSQKRAERPDSFRDLGRGGAARKTPISWLRQRQQSNFAIGAADGALTGRSIVRLLLLDCSLRYSSKDRLARSTCHVTAGPELLPLGSGGLSSRPFRSTIEPYTG